MLDSGYGHVINAFDFHIRFVLVEKSQNTKRNIKKGIRIMLFATSRFWLS
jgi:hypothetical protein